MSKRCYNYDSDEYEDIDKDGFSWSQGEFLFNWDDNENIDAKKRIKRMPRVGGKTKKTGR